MTLTSITLHQQDPFCAEPDLHPLSEKQHIHIFLINSPTFPEPELNLLIYYRVI